MRHWFLHACFLKTIPLDVGFFFPKGRLFQVIGKNVIRKEGSKRGCHFRTSYDQPGENERTRRQTALNTFTLAASRRECSSPKGLSFPPLVLIYSHGIKSDCTQFKITCLLACPQHLLFSMHACTVENRGKPKKSWHQRKTAYLFKEWPWIWQSAHKGETRMYELSWLQHPSSYLFRMKQVCFAWSLFSPNHGHSTGPARLWTWRMPAFCISLALQSVNLCTRNERGTGTALSWSWLC